MRAELRGALVDQRRGRLVSLADWQCVEHVEGGVVLLVEGEPWALKGHAVTMRLDVRRRELAFWSTAGMHATLTVPGEGALTAAVGLYNNTCTVTALRHWPG